jgi:Xaa-Pro aminopeptidase
LEREEPSEWTLRRARLGVLRAHAPTLPDGGSIESELEWTLGRVEPSEWTLRCGRLGVLRADAPTLRRDPRHRLADVPTIDPRARLDQLAALAREGGADVVLVAPGPDLRYLTGYDAKPLERLTCLVVPATGTPLLVVPTLERPAAEASPAGSLDIVDFGETDDPYAGVATLLADQSVRPDVVAVDNLMWAEKLLAFQRALPDATIRLAGDFIVEMRIRKSTDEVAALRTAGAAIDSVHMRMGEWLRPGRTEAAVAADIADAILAAGHVTVDFTIVGSGPNGASPHHDSSARVIEPGDPVVVDIGGTMPTGYCSDSTRTYVAGGGRGPSADFVTYYAVLQRAQDAACAQARPGVTCASVDEAARSVIRDAGFGEFFIHRTGHGIGLQGHEDPYIVVGNERLLEPGMAFSIEPGIYLPGRHGARIEDILVCTETGAERLNNTSRDLTVLPV